MNKTDDLLMKSTAVALDEIFRLLNPGPSRENIREAQDDSHEMGNREVTPRR